MSMKMVKKRQIPMKVMKRTEQIVLLQINLLPSKMKTTMKSRTVMRVMMNLRPSLPTKLKQMKIPMMIVRMRMMKVMKMTNRL